MKRTTKMAIISGGVVAVIACVAAAAVLGFELTYQDKAYPRISLGDTEVGGWKKADVQDWLQKNYPTADFVKLRKGGSEWQVPLTALGVHYETNAALEKTMNTGRDLTLVDRVGWLLADAKAQIEVQFSVDENKLVETATTYANQINVPAQEAQITIDKATGQIQVSPGENGLAVDEHLLVAKMRDVIAAGNKETVEIPVKALLPKLTEEQIEIVKQRAGKLVGKKLILTTSDGQVKTEVNDEQLVSWIDGQGAGWKRTQIEVWIAELATTIDRPAQNASFTFVSEGKVKEFRPAKDGYLVNQNQLTDMLISTLEQLQSEEATEKTAMIPAAVSKPEVNTGDVNQMGIHELLAKGESWYAGSITNRIFNLKKAAETLNGTLIAPGEAFSFNKTVGEISTATGYKSAFIIKDGKTILGDGGGVCQTSSTLFRAVLAAGLPIEERTSHAYRVSYYEQNYQPGFDATIFQPSPDFKFKNDTPGYVLIQMVFDENKKYLAFELYGTSDGRKAEISKARVWDVTPPAPDLYIDDPTMPVGKVVQTEHRANGAKVAFDWKVTRNGEVLQERTFYSNYRPWQAVYLRGIKI